MAHRETPISIKKHHLTLDIFNGSQASNINRYLFYTQSEIKL
ncbi:hypothetical protein B194_5160 [Serratia plymuthica A30]|nr:hypothetical protein B194_5160 [Serratia plymuthica A30]